MNGTCAKRHHFLPRLLLNGFASRSTAKHSYLWYFRRGDPPRETNIINVAAARYFHDRGDIEGKIATDESTYAELVAELRRGRVPPASEPIVAEFVSHLVVRTKNIRDSLTAFGETAVDAFLRVFTEPEHREIARRIMSKWVAEPRIQALLVQLPRWRRRSFIREAMEEFTDKLGAVRASPEAINFDRGVTDSQLRALASPVSAIDRTQRLGELAWSIERTPPGSLILGDVGPVGRSEDGAEIGSLLRSNGEVLAGVYLPVSAEYLLIGYRQGASALVEVETLNIATVESSRDFFVASQNTERERAYLGRVGRRADLIGVEEANALALSSFLDE